MGGFEYTTEQGEMWDYIAWRVYGDEKYVKVLYEANPQYLDIHIFDDGCVLWCPEIEAEEDEEDIPEWRDEEDLEEDALDGVSDEGDDEI